VFVQKVVDEIGVFAPRVFGTVIIIKRDVNGALLINDIVSC
jgi:hypothetical protein